MFLMNLTAAFGPLVVGLLIYLFLLSSLIPSIGAALALGRLGSINQISVLCAISTLLVIPIIGSSWRGTAEIGGMNVWTLIYFSPIALTYFFVVKKVAQKTYA
jgi:hypothetical protein